MIKIQIMNDTVGTRCLANMVNYLEEQFGPEWGLHNSWIEWRDATLRDHHATLVQQEETISAWLEFDDEKHATAFLLRWS